MSRPSRTTRLILTARNAARGIMYSQRESAVDRMATLDLPEYATVGGAKRNKAAALQAAVAALKDLDGEARTIKADRVMELADELQAMRDIPPTENTSNQKYYWQDME